MLQGQVALVTGGSRGIGRATCRKLAELGAQVIVNYSRSEKEAASIVQEINAKFSARAEALRFDVASPEEIEQGIERVISSNGRVDILINNAGVAIDGLVVRAKNADWQRTLDINLSGAFYCARAVARSMMKNRAGRIVNITSIIGQIGNAGQAAYSASKAGLIGLTKSLARELASRGITVNAVAPGYIVTDMTDAIGQERKDEMMKQIPLGRLGTVEDIAEAVAFLVSPAASYITGEVLSVNGGMHM
jgi:3-oxoacyl-[acyl-carrier protein] reductase